MIKFTATLSGNTIFAGSRRQMEGVDTTNIAVGNC